MSVPDHILGDDALATVWSAMHKIAPLSLADTSWDNVGVLLQAPQPKLNKGRTVMLAIDLTTDVADEVLAHGDIAVLVVYHPVIFRGLKSVTFKDSQQRSLLRMAAANISIYSPHTSLDACRDGINDWLVGICAPSNALSAQAIEPSKSVPEGHEGSGMGRLAHFPGQSISVAQLVQRVKQGTGLKHVQVAVPSNLGVDELRISSVAVCAGSGSSVLSGAKAGAYVTGEMSHHEALACVAQGIVVILTNHSNSERGYLKAVLLDKLRRAIAALGKQYQVCVSERDRDPLETM